MSTPEIASWIAAIVSLLSVWAYGRVDRRWLGPTVGLVSQGGWGFLAVASGLNGLLLSGAAFTVLHCWNLYKALRR